MHDYKQGSSLYIKCLRFFEGFLGFFFLSLFVSDFEGVRWGGKGASAVTKKGRGIQEWPQDMSLYSAKSNSKSTRVSCCW